MTRFVPRPDDRVRVRHLGAVVGGIVVRCDGPVAEVLTDEGETLVFELHRLTAHWVLRGGPYYGVRLEPDAG